MLPLPKRGAVEDPAARPTNEIEVLPMRRVARVPGRSSGRRCARLLRHAPLAHRLLAQKVPISTWVPIFI
jgi:hypothetical protein